MDPSKAHPPMLARGAARAARPGRRQSSAMDGLAADTAALERRLRPIFRQYPAVAAVYLFGSVSRGTACEGSDLDLGLVLDRNDSEDRHRLLGDLAARLEAVAETRPIDLVVLNVQGPVFCHEVILEGRLIYESDRERRIDFESDTIVRALDFRPTLEIATRGYLPAFRRWLRSYRDRERHPAPA